MNELYEYLLNADSDVARTPEGFYLCMYPTKKDNKVIVLYFFDKDMYKYKKDPKYYVSLTTVNSHVSTDFINEADAVQYFINAIIDLKEKGYRTRWE